MNGVDLSKEIIVGTKEVFSSMLMLEVEGEEVDPKAKIASNLTSMIGLGGGVRGVLAIHCPAEVAQGITGAFLGLEVSELDEDVKDAIGEIANMVAGNLKIVYSDAGVDMQLAIPTTTVGDSVRVSGISGAIRHRVNFLFNEKPFWIELLYVLS